MLLLGELLYSKMFVYSKLDDGNIGVRDHNVRSEIECGSGNSSLSQEQVVSVDNDAINGHLESYPPTNPTSSFSSCRAEDHPTVMRISHEQGRPDFGALVTDAVKGEAQPEIIVDDVSSNAEWMDSGIFMCGPNAMTSSVWKAVKTVERRQSCCNRGSSIAVYQEVFEL